MQVEIRLRCVIVCMPPLAGGDSGVDCREAGWNGWVFLDGDLAGVCALCKEENPESVFAAAARLSGGDCFQAYGSHASRRASPARFLAVEQVRFRAGGARGCGEASAFPDVPVLSLYVS